MGHVQRVDGEVEWVVGCFPKSGVGFGSSFQSLGKNDFCCLSNVVLLPNSRNEDVCGNLVGIGQTAHTAHDT